MSIMLGMIAAGLIQSSAAPAAGTLPAQGWVWALYDNGPVAVLAEEVPDTPHLRATLECNRNSGLVRLTHYQPGSASTGDATLSAARQQQSLPATVEGGKLGLSLRTNTPLFQSLMTTGRLSVQQAEQRLEIRFDRQGLTRLRRFAEACSG